MKIHFKMLPKNSSCLKQQTTSVFCFCSLAEAGVFCGLSSGSTACPWWPRQCCLHVRIPALPTAESDGSQISLLFPQQLLFAPAGTCCGRALDRPAFIQQRGETACLPACTDVGLQSSDIHAAFKIHTWDAIPVQCGARLSNTKGQDLARERLHW